MMMYNATFATNMISERVASDQASHAAARMLIPPIPRPCSLVPSVTRPLYSTTVSRALRRLLRGGNLWSNINLPIFRETAAKMPIKASRLSSCPVLNTSCRPFRLATGNETVKFSVKRTSDRTHCKRAEQTLSRVSRTFHRYSRGIATDR